MMGVLSFSVDATGLDAISETLNGSATKAEHVVAVQIQKDTSPFVPFRTGSLDQRTRVVGNKVIYPGPYARYLYFGKLMVDPETGSPWARRGARKVLTDRNLVFSKSGHSQAQSYWFEASKAQNLDKWLRVAQKAVLKYGND